jgi:hypothetical protein
MPQFELRKSESGGDVERLRARSPEEAVRRWLDIPADEAVTFEKVPTPLEALEGWSIIRVAGRARGRIRPHQRMRFRRD